jgi:hypothetical protein
MIMNERQSDAGLPYFLESFENLIAHFDEHFGDLGSNERGDSFLHVAEKLVPLLEEFAAFPPPVPNVKKSHDQGIDLLTSEPVDGKILCVQSKYKIRDKSAFDGVISKFKDFETSLSPRPAQPHLFSVSEEETREPPVPVFAVVTSSKLEGIINRYEESTLASKTYYESLRAEHRLTILDGPRILVILQHLYRKAHLIPTDLVVPSPSGWFNVGNVHIGAVRGSDLTRLYDENGDALFFENIRDFLGVSSGRVVTTRSTVNQEIIRTIQAEPTRMLARNNGITFRATEARTDSVGSLHLRRAAIVNGCQTTMCLVQCRPVSDECLVPVKVVVTEDAWDIAKATNYQNQVARVDLDLARYLRPQLARRAAARLGYAVEADSESTASGVLNTIYQSKIDYEELRLLYLGLFSRKPSNIFETNYTELRADVLSRLYEQAENEEQIFSVILLMLKHSRDALEQCQKRFSRDEYSHLFKRFFREDKPKYRSFLAVAATSSCVRDDISSRLSDSAEETQRMCRFLGECRDVLENHPDEYTGAYLHAFAVVADSLLDVTAGKDDADIQQTMYQKVSTMAFDSLYKRILLRMDAAVPGERTGRA